MKVLLTGSSGMVGKNIVDLKPSNIYLLTPNTHELNLLHYESTYNYIKFHRPNVIIHAAGIVGGIQANINHPVLFLRENTLIGHNLIWAAYENSTEYFYNLGSSCMYPKNGKNPLSEQDILKGELEPTNEGYALAKIFAQRFCSYINEESQTINYKTIIPCNLFGKYDKFDSEWGHMIPAVISKIHKAKIKNNENIEIWGDGTARREFMYAQDLADFMWYAVKNPNLIPELLNIGLGIDYTINEYYSIIAKSIEYSGSFIHDLSKPVGMKQKLVDTTNLKMTGWRPNFTIDEGIKETYKYFLENII